MGLINAMVYKMWTWMGTHIADASAHHTDHQSAASESASFKDVDIASGEGYKQGTNIILKSNGNKNIFIGEDAGPSTTGIYNMFIGSKTGYYTTTGYRNIFIGYPSGYNNIGGYSNVFIGDSSGYTNVSGVKNTFIGGGTGYYNTNSYNTFIGYRAGYRNTTAYYNSCIGYQAGYTNATGIRNTFIGYNAGIYSTAGYNTFIGIKAGFGCTTGYENTFIGDSAGYSNVSGRKNTYIGYNAGYYETDHNKLFIDYNKRANEADARIKALIYGVFDAAIANQLIRLNGILELTSIKSGSTQANAGAAINEVWKTNGHASLPDNVLMIGV